MAYPALGCLDEIDAGFVRERGREPGVGRQVVETVAHHAYAFTRVSPDRAERPGLRRRPPLASQQRRAIWVAPMLRPATGRCVQTCDGPSESARRRLGPAHAAP